MDNPLHVVTGAFGYSGGYIASRLLASGARVRTITNSLDRPERLVESLRGASVLYNTYWVRFNAPGFQHSVAVENSCAASPCSASSAPGSTGSSPYLSTTWHLSPSHRVRAARAS